MPYARTSFTHRSPKLPAEATTTRSSGESRLATADSMAAVPEPVKSRTSPSVANTCFSTLERLEEKRPEVGAAVVLHRGGRGGGHLRRNRRRARGDQVALG